MRAISLSYRNLFLGIGITALMLSGCGSSGSDGAPGAQGPAGPPGPSGVPLTDLNLAITSASINSKPVVNFTATDQDGFAYTRLTPSNLYFTVAKLTGATLAGPSKWQNYISTVQNASAPAAPKPFPQAVQGTRENNGTLVNHNDGTYTYTFAKDIATLTCPINAADPITACTDGTGKTINLKFEPGKTHRIGMQTREPLPATAATFDFVPNGSPVTVTRNMVRKEACNVCHDKLEAHDARTDPAYCVTCHNPGSTDPDSGHTVDFKYMIHKIHFGAELPSVNLGPDQLPGTGDEIPFIIYGYRNTPHNFSDIEFPAGVRSVSVGTPDLAMNDPKYIPPSTKGCTKCHNADDPKTPDASNFTKPNREACGACHDNISFVDLALGPDPDPNRTVQHGGGPRSDDSECLTCHSSTSGPSLPGSPTKSHLIRERSAGACFKYNILAVSYDMAMRMVTVDFSVTNPNVNTHPNPEAFKCANKATYDILNDPEWTAAGGASRLVVDVGWNTTDFGNALTPGSAPARTIEINALTGAVDQGGGVFRVMSPALPADVALCSNATLAGTACSGQVAIEGHPAVREDPTKIPAQAYTVRTVVAGVVEPFSLDGGAIVARRQPISVTTKCDRCHDVLSLHGSNRSESGQLCVMCHNPNNTDISRRGGGVGIDGKLEESIDFKRMIHAIHAAAATNFDGTTAHGFRKQGIVIYGFGGGPNDFSHLRFPGSLWKCETCHISSSFRLAGIWEEPAQNGILGSTIDSNSGSTDPSTHSKISPTAAVCSSCHDGAVAQSHMEDNGALFGATQAVIDGNVEACAACHGPGKIASVEFVHSEGFGEEIP